MFGESERECFKSNYFKIGCFYNHVSQAIIRWKISLSKIPFYRSFNDQV